MKKWKVIRKIRRAFFRIKRQSIQKGSVDKLLLRTTDETLDSDNQGQAMQEILPVSQDFESDFENGIHQLSHKSPDRLSFDSFSSIATDSETDMSDSIVAVHGWKFQKSKRPAPLFYHRITTTFSYHARCSLPSPTSPSQDCIACKALDHACRNQSGFYC